jgi:hypothetical protein
MTIPQGRQPIKQRPYGKPLNAHAAAKLLRQSVTPIVTPRLVEVWTKGANYFILLVCGDGILTANILRRKQSCGQSK